MDAQRSGGVRMAVVGGGPAGMLAALTAARNGASVTLFEKNEKLGKKLYLTGKGRCNVTNAGDRDAFFAGLARNPRFLYSAFAFFNNQSMCRLLEDAGVPLKTERGGRVFPVSDKSSDVLRALERLVRGAGVTVLLDTPVLEITADAGRVSGVRTRAELLPFDAVVLATGGMSYPSTGSTGDGYRFAAALGHGLVPPLPSLAGLDTEEDWPGRLAGLTLKNVVLNGFSGDKNVFSELGEMLFTHTGVSGPLVLALSARIADRPAGTRLSIDLKPGLSAEQLDARLVRDLAAAGRRQVTGALSTLLPARLLDMVFEVSGVDAGAQAAAFSRTARQRLGGILKALPLTVRGVRPLDEAIVTRGGVNVRGVNASTMESKLVSGLYFAGELLDVDARTGGYNLQIAWSSGALAGRSAARAGAHNAGSNGGDTTHG